MSYAGPTPRGKQLPLPQSTTRQFSGTRSAAASAASASGTTPRHSYDPRVAARAERGARRRDWDGMTVFAAGIAVGLAVGVGTALLFAPQTGEETRYAIARRARRLRRRGGDAWGDLRRELSRAAKRRMRAVRQKMRRKNEDDDS